MGGANSKPDGTKKATDFVDKIRNNVNDEIARRMMIQREIQMAVNIARVRDQIWIFGSLWAAFTSGVVTARIVGRPVHSAAAVPVVLGAIVLGNMADMAYGNKMLRVAKEAEHILDNERGRMVHFRQASFFKFYTDEEKAAMYDPATAVGDLFPNQMWSQQRYIPGPPPSSVPVQDANKKD